MFKTCEYCDANLDPGERCDCNETSERLRIKYEALIDTEHFQTRMRLEERSGLEYECSR